MRTEKAKYLQSRQVTMLSLNDWDQITSDINNPPALNKKMKKLLSKSRLKRKKQEKE